MKKICLTLVGIYLMFLSAFSQQTADTTEYRNQRVKLEEVNLVSGYYTQDGNHSAVTGGIGTQKLNDVSNIIELKFVNWNNMTNNKYTLNVEAGVDHHTAASQGNVSKTGASKPDGTRIYPSVNWQVEKENKTTIGFGLAYSNEKNYHSYSANFTIGKTSKDNSREVTFKAQAFFDQVTLYEPSEFVPKAIVTTPTTYTTASGRLVTSGGGTSALNIPTSPRNTFSASLTLSQVINKNAQFAIITDAVAQNGYLGLPFHRVYFNTANDSEKIENLPSSRFKLPLGMRFNYFLGDKIIFRTYYRYYTDSWGINSHTASLEVPYKISPFVSITPFYRYFIQTASIYFAPYKEHLLSDKYFTSNYDLSAFTSHFIGVNFRVTPKKGVFNMPLFNMIELRYGHYIQTTGLNADNIGVNLRFK